MFPLKMTPLRKDSLSVHALFPMLLQPVTQMRLYVRMRSAMRHNTSRRAIFCRVVFLIFLSSASFPAVSQGPNRSGLYAPPANNFILDPTENRVALDIGSLPLSEVQRQLDQARAANPDSPIVLTLTGIYQLR